MKKLYLIILMILCIMNISCNEEKKIELTTIPNENYPFYTCVKIINLTDQKELIFLFDTGSYYNFLFGEYENTERVLTFEFDNYRDVFNENFICVKSENDFHIDGVLGIKFLEKFKIVEFDFINNKIILDAQKNKGEELKYNKLLFEVESQNYEFSYLITLPVYYSENNFCNLIFDTGFACNKKAIIIKNKGIFQGENFHNNRINKLKIGKQIWESIPIITFSDTNMVYSTFLQYCDDDFGCISPKFFQNNRVQIDFDNDLFIIK